MLLIEKTFEAPDSESAMTEINFLESREQIKLYLEIGDKFNKDISKNGE